MRKTNFSYALALVPLLLGAGGDNIGEQQSGLTIIQFPICKAGQYLAYQSGGITCLSISGGGITLPNCTGQLLTGTMNGDVSTLACVAPGTGTVSAADVTKVQNLQTQITQIGTTIANLQKNPPSHNAVYVGSTTASTVGKVSVTGHDTGLNSANAMCSAQYAGSHLCTAYEMYNTVVAGKLDMTKTVPKSWIFAPSWNAPASAGGLPGTEDTPFSGSADNCGSMTYPTADRKWTGIAVEWTALSTGSSGFRFWGGSQATCHDSYPLACCK
jgi:hypothetical protein